MPDRPRINASDAATRLGVKRQTLYAYVSRGMLSSERSSDGRTSTFDPVEIDRLAVKGRSSGRDLTSEIVIHTSITDISSGRLSFRGHPIGDLAGKHPYEAVAELLWTGRLASGRHLVDKSAWEPPEHARDVRRALDALPPDVRLGDRLRVIVPMLAVGDHLRFDLRPAAVVSSTRMLIAGAVEALPLRGDARSGSLASRLWPRLSERKPTSALVQTLDTALALMADHELAASTFAARIAASVRSDPYAVVQAGLGAMAGPLHGSAAYSVHALFDEIGRAERAAPVIGGRLREGQRIPGFGHTLYPGGDPRARLLLAELRAALPRAGGWAVVDEVIGVMAARIPIAPNVDFASGAFAWLCGMGPDAAEAIFSIARCAGWIAHAIEEYEEAPVRFRPRARYLGRPAPPE